MSFFPLVMFGILQLITPSYYGVVWTNPVLMSHPRGFCGMGAGRDFIMYRMVNFDLYGAACVGG